MKWLALMALAMVLVIAGGAGAIYAALNGYTGIAVLTFMFIVSCGALLAVELMKRGWK